MPQFLKDREIAYERLTSMTIVETMAERKTAMLEQDELFIALPGGHEGHVRYHWLLMIFRG